MGKFKRIYAANIKRWFFCDFAEPFVLTQGNPLLS